jgi:hypothetical protein
MSATVKYGAGILVVAAFTGAVGQAFVENFIKPNYSQATSALRGEQVNQSIDKASGVVQSTEANSHGLKQYEPAVK